ncbi:F-box domain-containing protein [Artemisia annua]|uniref:F-box domain-containing protein n=1 Tax=Artemisia annua TaxID=35608 RepID=A0A2U1MMH8_ARTAN|nr:F-box domain-containing protein [Artemisia annua]
MILFSVLPLHALDDNVPTDDMNHSMVKLCSPCEKIKDKVFTLVGTFNGIVLMVMIVKDKRLMKGVYDTRMILYNPFTSESKIVRDPYSPCFKPNHTYGFGYGATTDDLKIVRFRDHDLDVFSLKTNSWSTSKNFIPNADFRNEVGTFLNGFLYWIDYNSDMTILALDVNKMAIWRAQLPPYQGSDSTYTLPRLGTLRGCLCTIKERDNSVFDVWVLEKQGVKKLWSNICSFSIGLEGNYVNKFHPINILDDGRILMVNDSSGQLIIYDTSKHSYKMLNSSRTFQSLRTLRGIEYVESLVSPSDLGCV